MRLFLLKPSKKLRKRIIGIFARAQKETGVRVHAARCMSNHWHGLVSVRNVEDLASFMQYVQSNLAKEVCKLHRWKNKVWGRRYKHSIVSPEREAEVKRLRYILANGCADNLVASPTEWICDVALHTLLKGKTTVRGEWVDRSEIYNENRRGRNRSEADCTYSETLALSPLQSFQHLSPQEYAQFITELVKDIEDETRARHEAEGTRPLGMDAVEAMSPYTMPGPEVRSPAPLFLTATRDAFLELLAAYREVLSAFLTASAKFRGGDRMAIFPQNTFPPALPIAHARGPDP